MRAIALAARAFELYPAESDRVRDQVMRAHNRLAALVSQSPFALEVLPHAFKVGQDHIGASIPTVSRLAAALHRRGISRLLTGADLEPDTVLGIAQLAVVPEEVVAGAGGVEAYLAGRPVPGLVVESIPIDLVFAQPTHDGVPAAEADAMWDALVEETLGDDAAGPDGVPDDPDALPALMQAVLERHDLRRFSRVGLTRLVCGRLRAAASSKGNGSLAQAAHAVEQLFAAPDPEAWLDFLAATIPEPGPPGEAPSPAVPAVQALRDASVRVALVATQALGGRALADLVIYALDTRPASTARIMIMFRQILRERDDRLDIAQIVRDETGHLGSMDPAMLALLDVEQLLGGERLAQFAASPYRIRHASRPAPAPPAATWPLDRVGARLAELAPDVVRDHAISVLRAVLEREGDPDTFARLAGRLVDALGELDARASAGRIAAAVEVLARHAAEGTGDKRLRRAAIEALVGLFTEDRVRGFARAGAGDEACLADVTRIFAAAGRPIVPALLAALGAEGDRETRFAVLRILAGLGADALDQAERHLNDPRWYFTRNLVWLIGEAGGDRQVPHLRHTLHHSDPRVRRETIETLGRIGSERAGELLASALDDASADLQLLAIQLIGRCRSARAIEPLLKIARRSAWRRGDGRLVEAAIAALGEIGDRSVVPHLEELARPPWLFRGRRESVVRAARAALEVLRARLTLLPASDLDA